VSHRAQAGGGTGPPSAGARRHLMAGLAASVLGRETRMSKNKPELPSSMYKHQWQCFIRADGLVTTLMHRYTTSQATRPEGKRVDIRTSAAEV
jgi:hypothetical protein